MWTRRYAPSWRGCPNDFRPGLRYAVAFDTTTFVGDSIREVLKTLVEAIIFVMIVMFVFLQDWRSTLIPAVTIPVSLVGAFAFIKLLDFSINTLTLFGIVLATGLVVDDAIVVIENIQRHMGEERCDSHVAASKAMGEVTGAVVATSLVLVAVFVPVAFFPGTTGLLYKQFSLTIAFAIAISAFNSLTFTPSLSALLLRPETGKKNVFFRGVEHVIHRTTAYYVYSAKKAIKLALPGAGALLRRTGCNLRCLQDRAHRLRARRRSGMVHDYGAGSAGCVGGVHLAGDASGGSRVRQGEGHHRRLHRSGLQLQRQRRQQRNGLSESGKHRPAQRRSEFCRCHCQPAARTADGSLTDVQAFPFLPPAIAGISSFGGFTFEVQDEGGNSLEQLYNVTQNLVREGNSRKDLSGLFSAFTANDPQFVVKIDRAKARSLQVPIQQISDALQVYMGSSYVNDFDFNNRAYRVYVQADQSFRRQPRDISNSMSAPIRTR